MNRLNHLSQEVQKYYTSEDPAHDWAHVLRVASNAEKICHDLGLDPELIVAGVYCHDLINLPKNHPDRNKASTLSAEEAYPLLVQAGFSPEDILIIKKMIVEHSYSKGDKPSCIESAIVQDSDRLDALGAIGILRCAAVNAKMGSIFYDHNDPLAEGRQLNDREFMLDHYFVKLFKLPDLMNTESARNLAIQRVDYMKVFLQQLLTETGL